MEALDMIVLPRAVSQRRNFKLHSNLRVQGARSRSYFECKNWRRRKTGAPKKNQSSPPLLFNSCSFFGQCACITRKGCPTSTTALVGLPDWYYVRWMEFDWCTVTVRLYSTVLLCKLVKGGVASPVVNQFYLVHYEMHHWKYFTLC